MVNPFYNSISILNGTNQQTLQSNPFVIDVGKMPLM